MSWLVMAEALAVQHQRWTIRLSDVDAPESGHGQKRPGQPYAARATQHVKRIALGRMAGACCSDADVRQGDNSNERVRYVCAVVVNGRDIGASLRDAGLAMANRLNMRCIRNPQTLQREASARGHGMGLAAGRCLGWVRCAGAWRASWRAVSLAAANRGRGRC